MRKNYNIKLLAEMFLTFFRIGTFTFGGGYAMLPIIEKEVITNKKWISEEQIMDIFALSQSLPGAIAINSSTFIGYKIAGIPGSIVATSGAVLPSFIIITIIAAFFARFQDYAIVNAAFLGIRAAVVGLILVTARKMAIKAVKNRAAVIILVIAVVLILLNVHPILVIIGGAVTGIIMNSVNPRLLDNDKELKNRDDDTA